MFQKKEVAALRPLPHSRNLRLHRWGDAAATFFVTKSLHPKKPILNRDARALIVSSLQFAVEHERIYLRAFIVMPDHWHALFAVREPWTLGRFMHDMMSYVGGKTAHLLRAHETAWQDSYYDTRVKTAKQFHYITHYIEENAVVNGLVLQPEEWDASSASQQYMVTHPWPLVYDEESGH